MQLMGVLQAGQKSNRVCVISSWDDADKYTFKLAKLLEKYKIKATFFVPIKPTKYGRITDNEIVELSKAYEIGGHSITHTDLTTLPLHVAKNEILECKKVLEQLCGVPISCFCYPEGKFNDAIKNIVKKSGFIAARTTKPYRIKNSDPFAMPTTIQCHNQNISRNIFNLVKHGIKFESKKWDKLAAKLFDVCLEKGGCFHFWGHAWEIEKENGWDILENLLSYISYRKDVFYLTMKDYILKVQ